MARNSALFQNAANMIKHAPATARSSRLRVSLRSLATPWLAASLRSSSLYVGLRCVASLRRSGLNFLFLRYPGVPRLRRSTAGLFYSAPPGLKFRLPSSLLRSYAVAGAYARKNFTTIITPSTSVLSSSLQLTENLNKATQKSSGCERRSFFVII